MADRLVVLREGRVQQIGTPEELHTRPANWHVADFMGYRNLLPHARPSAPADGDGRRRRSTGCACVGDRGRRRSRRATSVVAAVRPGGRPARREPSAPRTGCRAAVEVVEYQGRELAVEARTTTAPRLHAPHRPQRLGAGDAVTLAVDPARLLVFPATTATAPVRRRGPRRGLAVGRPSRYERPRGRADAEPGGTGWPSAASTGSCCCCCRPRSSSAAVRLPVPLRAGAVVPADEGRRRARPTTSGSSPTPTSATRSGPRCGSPCRPRCSTCWPSVPIAYRMRGRFRGKRLLTTLLVVPITLGTVLTAQGLLNFLGPTGWFNRVLMALGLIDEPVRLINNYWGVFFSLVITGFPFAFLLVLSYLSGIDPTLERAAATLGAGWWQRFRRITLPLLAPGLATTFCLTFVLAFSVFPSAVLVGDPAGETRVISHRRVPGGVRAVRLPVRVGDRDDHGRGRARRASASCCCGGRGSTPDRREARADDATTRRTAGPARASAAPPGRLARLGRRGRSSSSTWPASSGRCWSARSAQRWFDTWLPERLHHPVVRRGLARVRPAAGDHRDPRGRVGAGRRALAC